MVSKQGNGVREKICLLDIVQLLWPKNLSGQSGWSDKLAVRYAGVSVEGLSLDSRKVSAGDIFFGVPGVHVNGSAYATQAVACGAAAVLVQVTGDCEQAVFDELDGVPMIRVPRLLAWLSAIADLFYGSPSRQLSAVGITGTNGKTSIACMLADVLAQLQGKAGLIGTLGYGVVEAQTEKAVGETLDNAFAQLGQTGFTTPDALATQHYLAEIADAGCQTVAMEVSSHALVQCRVEAVNISIAVLSNITRDHLDFHGSMVAYAAAKRRLFELDSVQKAVLNLDDAYARRILPEITEGLEVLTYSTRSQQAAVYARNIDYSLQGVEADICFGDQVRRLHCPMLGEFYLSNSLAVVAILLLLGYQLDDAVSQLDALRAIPGRMQLVQMDAAPTAPDAERAVDISVVIDYAHTPDALKLALAALENHTKGQLVCVFGCGGNRDVGKRAEMGRIAQGAANKVYVTSDNPRDEDPAVIAQDILQGVEDRSAVVVELDREAAINAAICEATAGSLVLIAGKGHEQMQIIQGQQHPFSDYRVAQQALQRRVAA